MLPNGFAGQRLVLPLGSAWALAALRHGQRWAALGSAGQRWAALLVLAAVSSAGHLSAALGIGATQRWAALGLWQRWAALWHGQRCPALPSAAERCPALGSTGQRSAAIRAAQRLKSR